jgi:hypothetical protein
MKFNLNKDKFTSIDDAFSVLKEDNDNKAACDIIKKSLEDCFEGHFTINIVKCEDSSKPLFVMSVFPEMDTVMKIISTLSSNDGKKEEVIKKLWEQNKNWVIEIDQRILCPNTNFTNRELTALLLHEIGHVIYSNSLPYRITTVLQFELASAKMENKMLLKDRLFKKILSLPILNACIADDKSKGSVKTEIKADKFSQKMGYSKELSSVLSKLIKLSNYPKNGSIDKNMQDMANFSIDTVNQLRTRQDNIMKKNLLTLRKECASPYVGEVIQEYYDLFFQEHDDSSINDGKKLRFMEERAERVIQDGYLTEAFIFKSKLKRIDPAELDYIDIKTQEIKSDSDKMMLISYLHSKLDLIDYYISILKNPKLSKKYSVPHTIEQLETMRKRLLISRVNILNFKIPERTKGLYVAWPQNYEG